MGQNHFQHLHSNTDVKFWLNLYQKELKRIQIGDDCRFENVSQVIMDGCSKLEKLIIGANCFRLNIYNEMIDSDDIVGELNIMNCLVLSSVRIESESFTHFKELKIESK